jgi:hypothetical protein
VVGAEVSSSDVHDTMTRDAMPSDAASGYRAPLYLALDCIATPGPTSTLAVTTPFASAGEYLLVFLVVGTSTSTEPMITAEAGWRPVGVTVVSPALEFAAFGRVVQASDAMSWNFHSSVPVVGNLCGLRFTSIDTSDPTQGYSDAPCTLGAPASCTSPAVMTDRENDGVFTVVFGYEPSGVDWVGGAWNQFGNGADSTRAGEFYFDVAPMIGPTVPVTRTASRLAAGASVVFLLHGAPR